MATEPLPVDIGLVTAGQLSTREQRLIGEAGMRLQDWLARRFPAFRWQVSRRRRRDIGEFSREESSLLLRQAAEERDLRQWDFVLLVTGDELIAHYRPYALAALSRPLDAAIVSLARLAPDADPGVSRELSDSTMSDRLLTLMLHAVGHLAGLPNSTDPARLSHRPSHLDDLDAMSDFSDAECKDLIDTFTDLADTRLEETLTHQHSRWRFFVRATWINREKILESVSAAHPWQFPRHLNRLTTAAVSTIAILLMTAESWDLGLAQKGSTVMLMAVVVLSMTTAFVLARQQLLVLRYQALREQLVVTQVSAVLIVIIGLAVTWSGIWLLAFGASTALFDAELIRQWAASTDHGSRAVTLATYLKMSTFCASIGLLIGSLGASFEDQHHFQHVIFVDAEL